MNHFSKILLVSCTLLFNNTIQATDNYNAREIIKTITLEDYSVPELLEKDYKYNNDYNKLRIHLNKPENKIVFAINLQEHISLLHFKLNNKLYLDNNESNLLKTLNNINNNTSDNNDAKLLLEFINKNKGNFVINKYANNYKFYTNFNLQDNIESIKLSNNINTPIDQLKLDIYKQLQIQSNKPEVFTGALSDWNGNSLKSQFVTKYDKEYNAVYAYFLNEKFK